MKIIKTLFSPRKLAVWLFVVILLVTVPEISKPAMSKTEAIVTMLAVEKVDEDVKIATIVLAPSSEKTASYNSYYGVGKSLGEAVEKISLTIGKEMGFSQCEIMAFGDNVCESGIIGSLDYMNRTKKITQNAKLITFSGDIENLTNTIISMEQSKHLKLSDILNYDQEFTIIEDSNIDKFYKGYYSTTSIGMLSHISILEQNQPSTIEVEQKAYLKNDGSMSVFYQGKRVKTLTAQQAQGINFFLNKDYTGVMRVDGLKDDVYNNASVIFDITDTSFAINAMFEGEQPIYKIKTTIAGFIEEIIEENKTTNIVRKSKEYFTPTMIDKLEQSLRQQMEDTIAFCKSNSIDLIDAYRQFDKKANKKFEAYIDKVGIKKYLDGIQFEVSTEIKSTY